MIIGIGTDIVDIRRLRRILNRHGERFINRIFTKKEKIQSESSIHRSSSYAKRFSAKEACAKALGTGISMGIFWRDLQVFNSSSGAPKIYLKGNANIFLKKKIKKNSNFMIHLTMTDNYPWAHSVVIIETIFNT